MPSSYFDGMGDMMMGIFGECEYALLKPQQGKVQTIEVIFNAVHQQVDLDGKPIGAPAPKMWVKKDVACYNYGDIIELNGVKYIIREVQDDGLDLNELVISKAVDQ